MLVHLRVKNFALIEEAHLSFTDGLNVLTGETGAGKSILLEALGFALGNRLDAAWLREGKTLSVEAVFQISLQSEIYREIHSLGLTLEEETLHLKRESEGGGKTKSFLNGILVSNHQLKQIAPFLVDIFGQKDNQLIVDTQEQAILLDRFAGVQDAVQSFNKIYLERQELLIEKANLLDSLSQKEREMDLLKFQIQELESISPKAGEDSELAEIKIRLSSSEKLGNLYREAYQSLYESENSVIHLLGQASRSLGALHRIDSSQKVQSLAEEVENLTIQAGELARELERYGEGLGQDPEKLETVLGRIELLDKVKRKFGGTLEKAFFFLSEAKTRLEFLESSDENLKKFDESISQLEKTMQAKAQMLTKKRLEAARRIEKSLEKDMEELEMKGSRFEVRISGGDWNPRGKDQIEFYLSANTGESLKPLAKVASGGEVSRIQLALKRCFSAVQPVSTLIFDEIDAGIGSRLGPVIGEKLQRISKNHMVIAITHLAPVASSANNHWSVVKVTRNGQTLVQFKSLEGEARVEEIAKMLSGKKLTDVSLKHAQEILK